MLKPCVHCETKTIKIIQIGLRLKKALYEMAKQSERNAFFLAKKLNILTFTFINRQRYFMSKTLTKKYLSMKNGYRK